MTTELVSVSRADAELASVLRTSVMRLRRRLAVERHPANHLGLNAMAVLGRLHVHGDATVGELARYECVQPPSMTRTVNCLEEGGYVDRRAHESDGRQVVIAITSAGSEVVLADRQRRDAWLAQRLAELDAEEIAVLDRAAPILEALSQKE